MRHLFADDVIVSEADGFAQVVLRLDGPAEGTFTVNYATSNGYASYSVATDYTAVNSSVSFAPGETSKTVQIAITNNLVPESLEQFYLNLGVPAASQNLVTLSRSEIVVSIVDNDSTAGGTPLVSVGDVVADESTSQYARFVVALDRPSPTTVTVDWTTVGGSAAAGQDYVAASGTLIFLPGQTAQTVEVALTDDQLAEGSEQFRLQLGAAVGATIGQATGVATIAANDAPIMPKPVLLVDDATVSEADGYAELVLRLSAPSASAITVNYATSNGYASYSVATDYIAQNSSVTFAPGQTVHVVKVPINIGDNTPERTENFYLNLGLPAASQNLVTLSRSEIPVWIVDNDSTAGGTPIIAVRDVVVDESTSQYARFVVALDRPSPTTVTVDWTTAAGSAAAGQDYLAASGTLTFLPCQTAQTVEVALSDDGTPEGLEQFDLRLSTAVGAIVEVGSATATIGLNDGAISPKPVLRVDDPTVSEAGNYAQMVLRLDGPSTSTFTVNYATSNGTASYSVATDYIAQNSSVTFAPGQTVQVVQVPITNDTTPEAQEYLNFNLGLPAASANLVTLARPQIPVVIIDDDSGLRVLDYGMGDDLYVVIAASDWLIEAVDGGIDTVQTALDNYTLPANLDKLVLTGSANQRGFGNALDNVLQGGAGDDRLDGGAGTDTARYDGAGGTFTFARSGNTFTLTDVSAGEGVDVLTGIERLEFSDKSFELVNLPRTGVPAYGANSGFLFDAVYYLLDNSELVPAFTRETALQHYLSTGAAQGLDPNSWFDPDYYANRWADLTPLNLDAATLFMHYNLFGVWEGRSAGPKFDKFDGNRYLVDNPDVAAYVDAFIADFLGSRTNGAIAHYVIYGAAELRSAYDTTGAQIDTGYVV